MLPVDWIYHRACESIFKPMPTWIVRRRKWKSIIMQWEKRRKEIGIGAECALSQITCEIPEVLCRSSAVHKKVQYWVSAIAKHPQGNNDYGCCVSFSSKVRQTMSNITIPCIAQYEYCSACTLNVECVALYRGRRLCSQSENNELILCWTWKRFVEPKMVAFFDGIKGPSGNELCCT